MSFRSSPPDAPTPDPRLLETLAGLQLHDHLCLIYETQDEQLETVIPYIRIGMERNEQCLFIADVVAVQTTLAAMEQAGINTVSAIRSNALKIVSDRESYLQKDRFDSGQAIQFFRDAMAAAKASGFTALRITSEMAWPFAHEMGRERLIGCEAGLSEFLSANDALALCQYNRKRFPPDTIRDAIRTHSLVISGSVMCRNSYCVPPAELLHPDAAALEVDRLLNQLREHETAEQLLVKNNEPLQSMVNAITESAFLMDTQGTVLACNEMLAARLGCEASELVGSNVYDRIPADVAERRRKYVEQVIASGKTVRFEDERRGCFIDQCIYPVLDHDGKVSALAVFGQDITARRLAEKHLQESREQYCRIVETANDGVWSMDHRRVTTFVNARMAESLGYTIEEMIGRPVEAFMFSEELPDHESRMRDREAGACGRYERRFRHKDGTERWMLVSATAVMDVNGTFAGSFGMFSDITDRKLTEQSLKHSTQLLDSIRTAQSLYITRADPQAVFGSLLQTLVSLTGSQYGFLDEVLQDGEGKLHKRNLAITDISWDEDSRRLYEHLRAANFEFRNLANLAGAPATSGRLVIANDPGRDPRSGGLPEGHPSISAFMGIPMYFGGELVGIAGVANRPGGYDEGVAASLEPFVATCAGIIHAARNEQREKTHLEETQVSLGLLHILNSQSDLHALVKSVTTFLQDWSGCEAVGIRLKQGHDYPYFESRGFPPEFIQAENWLCSRDESNELLRDNAGNPVLECMCGSIIFGRFDPSKPFFTPSGSFWSNSTTELLASSTEADRQARTRNRCNGEGYESVALIPLRADSVPLGLLQLNDKRKGRFTPPKIALLERLAVRISATLAQRIAEAKADRSRAELKAIYDNAPVMLCVLDEHRCVVYANRAFTEFVGKSEDELKSDPACGAFGCINALDDPRGCGFGRQCEACSIRLALEDTLRTGTSHRDIEYRTTLILGSTEREVTLVGATARIEVAGKSDLLLCLADITDRKRAEEAVRESEQRFRAIFENSGFGIAIARTDGRLIRVNNAFCRMLGYTPEELCARTVMDITPPDDIATELRQLEELLAGTRQEVAIEKQFTTKNGTTVWGNLKCCLVEGSSPGERFVVGIVEDTTRRREREQQLRFQAMVLDDIDDQITTTDLAGRITYVNKAQCRMFGRSREELIGRSVESYGSDASRGDTQEDIIRRTLSEGHWSGEVINQIGDGREATIFCRTQLVRDENGRPIAMCGIGTDVTARKQAEEERQRLEEQLLHIQKLDALGNLAAGVAHDFNNLLTVIRLHADMAHAAVDQEHPLRSPLEAIQQTANQAARITKSLLTFGQVMPTEIRPVRLCDMIQEAKILLKHVLPSRIRLIEETDPACACEVMADQTQMHQVLLNLAINARDAMPEGGILTLGVSPATVEDDSICPLRAGSRCVRIFVADSGTGIKPELLPRIFDPFFTTKSRGEGTGLGLSLVHGIVADHGGHITFDSQVGKGTTFTITLPAVEQAPELQDQTDVPAETPRGAGELILIAMPDRYKMGTIAGFLQSIGYQVLIAHHADEVHDLLGTQRREVQLVVLADDLMEEGAHECLSRARAISPHLPAIILSGDNFLPPDAAAENTRILCGPLPLSELAKVMKLMTSSQETAH